MDKKFEPHIASLFNQTTGHEVGIKTKPDLIEVIFMDSQSKMDLFCNRALVENTTKSKMKMQLKRNDGTMTVSHQATGNV